MTAEDRDYFKSFANAFWSPSSSSEASPQKTKKKEKKTHKDEKEKKHKKEKKHAKEKTTKKTQKEKSKQSSQDESESDEVEDAPAPAAIGPPVSSPPLRLRVSGGTNKSYIQEKSGTKWLLLCNVEAPRVKDHRNCMDLVMKEANQNMQQLSQCDFDGRKTMMSKLRDKAHAVFNNDD